MKGDKRTVALLQEKIPRSSSLTSSEMSDNVSLVLELPLKGLKIIRIVNLNNCPTHLLNQKSSKLFLKLLSRFESFHKIVLNFVFEYIHKEFERGGSN